MKLPEFIRSTLALSETDVVKRARDELGIVLRLSRLRDLREAFTMTAKQKRRVEIRQAIARRKQRRAARLNQGKRAADTALRMARHRGRAASDRESVPRKATTKRSRESVPAKVTSRALPSVPRLADEQERSFQSLVLRLGLNAAATLLDEVKRFHGIEDTGPELR